MDIKDIKIIDIHAHATPFPESAPIWAEGKPWISPEELIAIYDKCNVEKGVLLPLTSPEYHFEQITTGGVKHIVDKYPDRFLWFCSVDPRGAGNFDTADLSKLFEHYKSLGAKGVGEVIAQLYFDDKKMDNLFFHAARCDLPVTIHISKQFGYDYGIVDDLHLPRLEKMLKKHKNLKILGHSQCFWSEISSDVTEETRAGRPTGKVKEGRVAELMRNYENLYCDFTARSGLTAFMRDPEYTARFIEEFSDRILMGYDICLSHQTHQYTFNEFMQGMVEKGYVTKENYYKIVRGNAEKLLKL